jgi:hypothetical protein
MQQRTVFQGGTYLLYHNCDLEATKKDRCHSSCKQDRAKEEGKMLFVLVLDTLEVRLPKKQRSVEVESSQPYLAIHI